MGQRARFCWVVTRCFFERLALLQGRVGVVAWLLALVGLGGLLAAITWNPWSLTVTCLTFGWLLLDAVLAAHRSVPTGNAVAHVRLVLRQLADKSMCMRADAETTMEQCDIWFSGVMEFVESAGNRT